MSYFSSFKHKLIVNSNYNLSFSSKKSRYHDILGDGFKIMLWGLLSFIFWPDPLKMKQDLFFFSRSSK